MTSDAPDVETIQNWMLTACEREDTELMQRCLDVGADPDAKDRNGVPLLLVALDRGSCGAAALLLYNGATVSNEPWGALYEPPIIMACRKPCLSALELLIAGGADVNVRDSMGMTVRDYARKLEVRDPQKAFRMANILRGAGVRL